MEFHCWRFPDKTYGYLCAHQFGHPDVEEVNMLHDVSGGLTGDMPHHHDIFFAIWSDHQPIESGSAMRLERPIHLMGVYLDGNGLLVTTVDIGWK
jgi:hypothetical protein